MEGGVGFNVFSLVTLQLSCVVSNVSRPDSRALTSNTKQATRHPHSTDAEHPESDIRPQPASMP